MLPMPRLLPFTVRMALEADNGAVPRTVFPSANDTFPVGETPPFAGLTAAVSIVDAVGAIVAGFALIEMVVAIAGSAATVTIVDPDELLKFPLAT